MTNKRHTIQTTVLLGKRVDLTTVWFLQILRVNLACNQFWFCTQLGHWLDYLLVKLWRVINYLSSAIWRWKCPKIVHFYVRLCFFSFISSWEPWFGLLVGTIRLYLYTKFDALTTNVIGDINHSNINHSRQNFVKIGYIYIRGYWMSHPVHP